MKLLREHANQILPHPITISIKPGYLFLLKDLLLSPLSMDQLSSGHSHNTHCCQAQWDPLMTTPLKEQLLKPSREHFTVVLLANAHPNAYISCSPILKFPPLYHTTCLLLLIKNLTSCTSRDINLSKTAWKNYCEGPIWDATGA
jgi:hypothetical protein